MLVGGLGVTTQELQSFTKYLRLTLVFLGIVHYGKRLVSVFQEFFAATMDVILQ